ncbi:hypothetical protein [Lysobacter sp. Hz 25]|uniref:hypothetical protein n=1 Tax=Lysobacter sp. Hz 25 TaxID=3383698 RepID=UPI0038D458C3
MPLHQTAFFQDDNKQWVEAHYKELARPDRRAYLKARQLRERPNGDIRLGIRNHPETPHFFARRPLRRQFDARALESEEHNKGRDILRGFLNKNSTRTWIGYYETPWLEDKGFEKLLDLKEFKWEKEVAFGLVRGRFIRFDLLGRSDAEIELTDKNPFVAIEVVDTHFHSIESFRALLQASSDFPLVVAYYFIQKGAQLNCMYGPGKLGRFARLRIQAYIADGSFWLRDDRIEDQLPGVSPAQPDAYYHAVKERLYGDGWIRREPDTK